MTDEPMTDVFRKVKVEIEKLIDEHHCGPLFVRLAWNDAATYSESDGNGGPHATMRFEPVASYRVNKGLSRALDLLNPIKEKFHEISYADLWQYSAVVAINKMGGPEVPFRYGRMDHDASRATPEDRLPSADSDAERLRDLFSRKGFTEQEIVALSGAHCVGQFHEATSGFQGKWTADEKKFSNQYFVNLLKKKMDRS